MLFDDETSELFVYVSKNIDKIRTSSKWENFSCLFMPFHVFLTVVSDRIARAFNRSGATRAVA